jgi:hypothetical protein
MTTNNTDIIPTAPPELPPQNIMYSQQLQPQQINNPYPQEQKTIQPRSTTSIQQVEEDPQESGGVGGMAFDLIMVITKVYAIMVLKFGDTIAKIIIGMVLPSQVSDQIINGKPVDIKIITPILTNAIYVLQDPEFRKELAVFFTTIQQRIGPHMSNLLTQISKIFLDVMTKNASKLISVMTTSMSAFPPAALFFDLTTLASAGVNTFTNGFNLVGMTTSNVKNMASQVSEHAKPLSNKFNELINKIPQSPAEQTTPPELSRSTPTSPEENNNSLSFMQKAKGLFSRNKTKKNNANTIQTGGHMKTKKIVNRIIKSLNDFKNTDIPIQKQTIKHTNKKNKYRTRKYRY